jgi:hypothetical protein
VTYEEFQRALREAVDRVARSGAGGRDVRIADLRHAVGNNVSHTEFDDYVRRLRSDGLVAPTAHVQPALLDGSARQDSLLDGLETFYFLRWLS